MKIRRIKLTNFQSHESTELELDPNLNVIVGSSDSGKTAILRAIHFVFKNKISGLHYIKHGKSRLGIEIEFDDGTILTRAKGKKLNAYEIKYPNGEYDTFTGFGLDVPDEVYQVTGVGPVVLGKTSMYPHIATQLEPPFMIGMSATERMNVVGELSGVHLTDTATSIANADLSKNNVALASLKNEQEAKYEELEQYGFLDTLEPLIDRIEEKRNRLLELASKMDRLQELKRRMNNIQQQKSELIRIIAYKNIVNNLIARANSVNSMQPILDSIKDIKGRIETIQDKRSKLSVLIAHKDNVNELILRASNVSSLRLSLASLKELNNRIDKVQGQMNKIKPLLNIDLSRPTAILSEIENGVNSLKALQHSQRSINSLKLGMNQANVILSHRTLVNDLQAQIADTLSRHNVLNGLYNYKRRLDGLTSSISKCSSIMAHKGAVHAGDKLAVEILRLDASMSVMMVKKSIIVKLGDGLKSSVKAVDKAKNDLSKVKDKYISALEHHLTCPVCMQSITNDTLQLIKESL